MKIKKINEDFNLPEYDLLENARNNVFNLIAELNSLPAEEQDSDETQRKLQKLKDLIDLFSFNLAFSFPKDRRKNKL